MDTSKCNKSKSRNNSSSTCFITRILCWVFAWFYPLSQDSVQQMMSGLMWFTVAANSEVLSYITSCTSKCIFYTFYV
jgi:hypothetical protein